MRYWFFGENCLVRYESDDLQVNRVVVRVHGGFENQGPETPQCRVYYATRFIDGQQDAESTPHETIQEAIETGEQWLP